MSQSRSLLPMTASPRGDLSRPDPTRCPGDAALPPAPCAPTPGSLPPPRAPPAASLPVTAGAAGSRAEADVGDRGEPPARGGHVWASGGVQAETGGSPGPAPPSRRLWGV